MSAPQRGARSAIMTVSRCKDCGGAGICEHDRQRSSCKDRGGSSASMPREVQVQGLRGRLFICEAAGALGAAEGGRAADELAEHGAGEGAVEQRDARGAF